MSTMTSFGRVPAWGFGDRIRKIRRELRMSQHDFAASLGVGEKAVASWESGRTTPDDLVDLANRVQRQWQFSAAWLAGVDTPPDEPGHMPGTIAGIVADTEPRGNIRRSRHSRRRLFPSLASAA